VRYPEEWYQLEGVIAQHFPDLRPAQQRGLATWVYGTILAGSGCQSAVSAALEPLGGRDAVRQLLREWLYDGKDKAAPCGTQVDLSACFAPLLRWIVSWWQGNDLALAFDATAQGDQVVVLAISVLYRGSAIPVAWHVLPANVPGAWLPHFQRLLRLLAPAVPAAMRVIVMADRGLWSPVLWDEIRGLGWHPLLRIQASCLFQPTGQRRQPRPPSASARLRDPAGRSLGGSGVRLPPASAGQHHGCAVAGGARGTLRHPHRSATHRGRRLLVRVALLDRARLRHPQECRLGLAADSPD